MSSSPSSGHRSRGGSSSEQLSTSVERQRKAHAKIGDTALGALLLAINEAEQHWEHPYELSNICVKGSAAVALLLGEPVPLAFGNPYHYPHQTILVPKIAFDAYEAEIDAFYDLIHDTKFNIEGCGSADWVFRDCKDLTVEIDGSQATFVYRPRGILSQEKGIDLPPPVTFTAAFAHYRQVIRYFDRTAGSSVKLRNLTFTLFDTKPPQTLYLPPLLLVDLILSLESHDETGLIEVNNETIETLNAIVLIVVFGLKRAFGLPSDLPPNVSEEVKFSTENITHDVFSRLRDDIVEEAAWVVGGITATQDQQRQLARLVLAANHKQGYERLHPLTTKVKSRTNPVVEGKVYDPESKVCGAFKWLEWLFNDWYKERVLAKKVPQPRPRRKSNLLPPIIHQSSNGRSTGIPPQSRPSSSLKPLRRKPKLVGQSHELPLRTNSPYVPSHRRRRSANVE